MRLVITGYGRHGKDTVCEMLSKEYGLNFVSSSSFVAEKAVRPWLEARGVTYVSLDEMYQDRVNRRAQWKQAISEYNTPNPSRLGTELFASGNDIYCGLRDIRELVALRPTLDRVAWVDASLRLPPEDVSSITIKPEDCDLIINNNSSFDFLKHEVKHFAQLVNLKEKQ